MKRLLIPGTAVVAVGVAGAVLGLRDGSGSADQTGPALATATVERTDLADRTELDGTLGYAKTYTVTASGQGRLTWLPAVGAVIRRGARSYGVDGHTVPLFYGPMPLWRTLEYGMTDGRDVLALERNLTALGYGDGLTVDRHFSAASRAAVKDWQDDLGVTETGAVQIGDVVVQPGALRVTTVDAVPGGPAHGTVLKASSAVRQVTVNLPVAQQEIAKAGAKVQVALPGGTTAAGHISSVGTVASNPSSASEQPQPGQDTQEATIPVYVTLDRPSSAGRLDGAPVTVGFTTDLHKNVLAVPVNALLAVSEGTYAVAVAGASGQSTRVPVELGFFADGKVEVTGELTEGMKVEVPRS
jgi:peptidoglycan hydrolase-like protein with peptidoglycan-binding domain